MADLFMTKRTKAIKLYEKAGQPFVATTKPYVSTLPIVFDVVEPYPKGGPFVMAHAVARASQSLSFFSYGVRDNIGDGFGNNYNATNDDTNQATKDSTNGGEDFIIEGVSASARSVRQIYDKAAFSSLTDPDIINWYNGVLVAKGDVPAAGIDPAALGTPPQESAPANLEQALMSAVMPHLAVNFSFDRKRVEYVGTMDEFPEGGARSYLRANGEPRADNRYRIPEGYMWHRKGVKDSEFNLIANLARPVIVPISLLGLLGTANANEPLIVVPTRIALDIKVRLHGLSLDFPSEN